MVSNMVGKGMVALYSYFGIDNKSLHYIQPIIFLYFSLPNNSTANLTKFLKFSNLHTLNLTCTFNKF